MDAKKLKADVTVTLARIGDVYHVPLAAHQDIVARILNFANVRWYGADGAFLPYEVDNCIATLLKDPQASHLFATPTKADVLPPVLDDTGFMGSGLTEEQFLALPADKRLHFANLQGHATERATKEGERLAAVRKVAANLPKGFSDWSAEAKLRYANELAAK